ncbi:hypothetical protein INT43_002198 [Umbelopsis isabellina]|uniref:Uncharacterized protein n=1 Tax=Mortierella isabellina TaxID=91625 RepID=A0A8H7Q4K2_MORIS|nr:hypothetical protein INT43_002198 [Umbelopsis isabellina]
MLPIQSESYIISPSISDVEEALDSALLPTLPVEAPLSIAIPETFELTIGNSVPLTSENVETYVTSHLVHYIDNSRLNLRTAMDTFLQLFSLEHSSPQRLWHFLSACKGSMLIGDTGLKEALGLVEGTASLNLQEIVPGTKFLYVRSFAVPTEKMRDIMADWEAVDYFPDEAAVWEDNISRQDTLGGALVDVRYVGQCAFPSTPEGRFAEDAASRNNGVLSHFLTSLASVCPEAYHAAKVLVLGTTFGDNVAADVVDDFERLFIGFLGYDCLLNRQQGGYYDRFDVSNEHKVIFTNLQTRIVDRWIAKRSDISQYHEMSISLRTRVQGIRAWMHDTVSIMHSINAEYVDLLWTESTPRKYQGNVITCLVAKDITVEDFLQQKDYLDRISNTGTKSRSAAKFLEAVQALVECEGHNLSQLQTESNLLNLFPFVNMFPWVGPPFLPSAIDFLGRYLQIVQPIIVVAIGEEVANVIASNMIHASGLPNGKYTEHVGIPRIMSCASEDWLNDENVDEPDSNTLSIVIPIFDPVLFLHISEAMKMLDEGVMLHPATRKRFLVTLRTRCSNKMEESGLQNALETTRGEVQAEWQRQAAIRFKPAPPNELFRMLRHHAAKDVMRVAEKAMGHPSIHAHQEEAREAWEVFMKQIAADKYYSTSIMARHQSILRIAAGKHPLAQILRQYPPADAQNDHWMWDEELAAAAYMAHGERMMRALKQARPYHFSSENQRLRALARHGTDPNFPVSLHGQRVSVAADGRMTVHWRDTESQMDETFKLYCKEAYHASNPSRTLQVTTEGIEILDEAGRLIQIHRKRRLYNCFLLKTWVKSLEGEGISVPVEEPVAGDSGARIVRSRLKYDLPVAVNDEVTPFKRFLDDTWPGEGVVFFGQADRQSEFPADSQALMIWGRLKEHLEIHSRGHPHFDFWMNLTNGVGDNRKAIQHLKKLRPVTLEREKFSFVAGQTSTGLRKRIKGKLIKFGPPLPGAERNVYR